MNKFLRVFLAAVVIIYIISPVDLVPGPLDDVLFAIVLVYKLLIPLMSDSETLSKHEEQLKFQADMNNNHTTKTTQDYPFNLDDAGIIDGEELIVSEESQK